ncbi:MAG: hypothetical protein WKF84_16005 [Pyrinomonadaceae bacterium]
MAASFLSRHRHINQIEACVAAPEVFAHFVFGNTHAGGHECLQLLGSDLVAHLPLIFFDASVARNYRIFVSIKADESARGWIAKRPRISLATSASEAAKPSLAASCEITLCLINPSSMRRSPPELGHVELAAEHLAVVFFKRRQLAHHDVFIANLGHHIGAAHRVGDGRVPAWRVEKDQADDHQDGKNDQDCIARPFQTAEKLKHC